jgi:hypothetical protein
MGAEELEGLKLGRWAEQPAKVGGPIDIGSKARQM